MVREVERGGAGNGCVGILRSSAVAAGLLVILLGYWWLILKLKLFPLWLGAIHSATPATLVVAAMTAIAGVAMLALISRLDWTRFVAQDFGVALTPVRVAFGVGIITLIYKAVFMHDAAVADDETCYLYAARLLSMFKLSDSVPVDVGYYRHVFLIQDVRSYTQYYLGWPALLAPFAKLHAEMLAGSVFGAIESGLLFAILRRHVRAATAAVMVLAQETSVFSLTMHSGLLAYGPCVAAILAAALAVENAKKGAVFSFALAGLALSVAVWIRPADGLAAIAVLSLPIFRAFRDASSPRSAMLAFMVAPCVLGGLFVACNIHLYGGIFDSGYSSFLEFEKTHQYPTTSPTSEVFYSSGAVLAHVTSLEYMWSSFSACVLRLVTDGPFVVVPFIWLACFYARAEVCRYLAFGVLLVAPYMPFCDFGIDTFGPVHLYASMVLLLIPLASGLEVLADRISSGRRAFQPTFAASILAICALISWLTWQPLRMATLGLMMEDAEAPLVLASKIKQPLLVFYARGWTQHWTLLANHSKYFHFRFWPPIADPAGGDHVIWALSTTGDYAQDHVLADKYPDRRAFYLLFGKDGKPAFYDPKTQEIVDGKQAK